MYVNHKRNAVICLYTLGGNTICYISCWLVIGIRINPLWGLTVAFSIFSTFAALTYVVYLIFSRLLNRAVTAVKNNKMTEIEF